MVDTMIKVKICGLTTLDDARMVAQAGADMLGFNFYKLSPRYIDPLAAQSICDTLRSELGDACPVLVGVFVNATADAISEITNQVGLDFAQLSGDESDNIFEHLKGMAYKAIRPMNEAMALDDVAYFRPHFASDERIPSLLLDAYHPNLYGGTGEQASADVALKVKAQVPRLMLAGGLTPENVAARVQAIRPWGVDVASGVEDDQPGLKSETNVQAFIQAARGA